MNTQTLELPVLLPTGPDCKNCVARLHAELVRMKGVTSADVNSSTATIQIAYDPNLVTLSRIEQQARKIGADISADTGHETIGLRDMDCPDCASSIEKAVKRLPGILWASANFASAQMVVEFERGKVGTKEICKVIEGHGIRACALGTTNDQRPTTNDETAKESWLSEHRRSITTAATLVLTTAGVAAYPVSVRGALAFYAAAILIGGWTTARSGWMALRARALDMNVLMTIAVIGAAAIGDWFEAATVVALYSLGNLLQAGAMERTRRSIRGLMQLAPPFVRVRRAGSEMELRVEQVLVDDLVVVKPGERIAMDGTVSSGSSSVNEAPITGESSPVEKSPGDTVFAGTLNGAGALEFLVTHPYKETTLARIIHRVEEAQAQRAPTQQLIDRFASRYTPIVVGLAAGVAVLPPLVQMLMTGAAPLWGVWFLKALSLLIIACPCALVISTPVAIVTAIGNASRNGALIKGGAFLEEVGQLKAILYDKTGTLTTGNFLVDEVATLAEMSKEDIIAIAAAIESRSEHPLAAAFSEANHRMNGHKHLEAEEFTSVPGRGAKAIVEGVTYLIGNRRFMAESGINLFSTEEALQRLEAAGRTVVILADGSYPLGLIALSDTVRPETAAAVARLKKMGLSAQAIITGDNARVAEAVGTSAGIDKVHASLLPEDKLRLVNEYRERYGAVGMVGDGVNDAPALAAANVGIAMGAAGSDTAMETADIALMGDDLSRLPALISLSRRTRAIMQQNIVFSLATKLGLIVAAVTVGLPLWLAVVGDVGVSLVVTLNALRLRSNGVS
jgi:Cd2+/Zn2+-exporting ATPase